MNNEGILELKWGTKEPFKFNDLEYGELELKFMGYCRYKINNDGSSPEQIENYIYNNIIEAIKKILSEKDSKGRYETLYYVLQPSFENTVVELLQNSGIIIETVYISSINLTDSSKQKLEEIKRNSVTVIKTDEGAKDGQNKCPKCGATEISINVNNGKLRCNYCRYEFEPEKVEGLESDISKLKGQVIGSGAQDIVADTNDVLTFKCSSCGAEVVIDTSEATQARCHWCRSTLSVNQQIPNGSVPDVVLPFTVKKEDAKAEIEKFVGKRKFYAHPKFKEEFTTENIMGVYFPYMLVDVNAHSNLVGQGERLLRTYTRGSGDDKRVYYDADLYDVSREFDITIEGLTVESSADKLNKGASDKTTNVINAIMPFDVENAVKWNANYLKGYTSEKRDINIEQLKSLVDVQSKDIARYAANDTLKEYDRGVAWSKEDLSVNGQRWKAAYLPVWLYSYQEIKGDKKLLHYVAVNARTKETMGSVPIHMPKLIIISMLVELLGFAAMLFVDSDYRWIFLLAGLIYFFVIYSKYRNKDARHKHELETKKNITNLRKYDKYIGRRTGLSNSMMNGANNKKVGSNIFSGNVLNKTINVNTITNIINNNIDKGI